jgi:predicted nuclease of predicted toxin-antitoxin system
LVSAIRLYFDEGVQVAVAEQLRLRGIDAVHIRDLGLRGDSDINHLQRASEMGRVVCTFDYDFIRLHKQGIQHQGIIIAQHATTTIGDWVRGLELICGVLSADDMKSRVEYL